MALTVLNSVSSLNAENALSNTQANLQKTLNRLSTGLKINSGSDDAAGLSIATGMSANIAALNQSQQNASNTIGVLQTADGALSQVGSLLNRAVTLATEAGNAGLTSSQSAALDSEYTSIQDEIDQIGKTTNFNGQNVFTGDATMTTAFISDGKSAAADSTISATLDKVSASDLALGTSDLTSTSGAQTELAAITTAIDTISSHRGDIGATVNRLTAATSNMANTVSNLQSATNSIQNADIGKTVADMTQYNVLQSTGMSALQQSNQAQQAILKLVQ